VQIAGMYVHDTDPTYPDQCTMDLVVSWRGDPDIVIAVTGGRSLANRTFNVALTNLEFQGKFRICIKPLLNVLPCIGGMNLMLVSEPYINYELRLKGSDGSAGMNLDRIPLLKTVVIKIIQGLISDVLLFPNCVPIAIATDSAADEPGTLVRGPNRVARCE
jgi:Ca2+-dependent lipid-binding protein